MSDELQAFVQVFEQRSFSAAARALAVDPSVVSRRVRALEDRLGVPLLQRSTRRVEPTAAGEDLYERVAPALRALHDAALEVGSGADALRGRVRVSAPGALGRLRVAPAVFTFVAAHPEVRVDLRLSDTRVDLVQERIDVAIRVGEPRGAGLVTRSLGVSPQVLVASPAYVERRGPVRSLDGHDIVLREEGGVTLDDLPTLPGGHPKPSWRVALTTDEVEVAAAAVAAGLGVGILPLWLVREELEQQRLVRVSLPLDPGHVPMYAALPAGRRTPRRVRALLEHLERALTG
ncbi:MAG: LysR substrate-binding domain-containing protein [Myxococcota bacterium]